jgi:hypothetical protein
VLCCAALLYAGVVVVVVVASKSSSFKAAEKWAGCKRATRLGQGFLRSDEKVSPGPMCSKVKAKWWSQ